MQPLSISRTAEPVLPTRAKQKRASFSSFESELVEEPIPPMSPAPPPRYGLDLRRHSLTFSPPTTEACPYHAPSMSRKLSVAVPIAMPRRPLPCLPSPHDVDMEKEPAVGYLEYESRDVIPEFCLGVSEVWQAKVDV